MNPIHLSAGAVAVSSVLVAFPALAHGQAGRTVRGTVVVESDGKPVADAVIKVIEPSSGRFTYSSAAGRFELRVPDGEARLLVARIGYAPDTVTVGPDGRRLDVRLRASAFALDPITVSAEPTYSAASSRTIRELDIQLRPREARSWAAGTSGPAAASPWPAGRSTSRASSPTWATRAPPSRAAAPAGSAWTSRAASGSPNGSGLTRT